MLLLLLVSPVSTHQDTHRLLLQRPLLLTCRCKAAPQLRDQLLLLAITAGARQDEHMQIPVYAGPCCNAFFPALQMQGGITAPGPAAAGSPPSNSNRASHQLIDAVFYLPPSLQVHGGITAPGPAAGAGGS